MTRPTLRRRGAHLALLAAAGVSAACASILGLPRDPSRPFEHKAHADQGVHCLDCHRGVEIAGDDAPLHIPTKAGCIRCHEQPHDNGECGDCHGLPYTRGAAARARAVLSFDHGKHRAATKADCVRCHADSGSGATVMRPRMATCLTCHEHDAEMATQSCDRCHADLQTEGTQPEDHTIHDSDFSEHHAGAAIASGALCSTCHAERFCASCHAGGAMPVTPAKLELDTRGAGIHRGNFLARHKEEAASSPGLCASCHAPESCSACHARRDLEAAKELSRNPHPAGWVGPRGARNDHGPAVWRDPSSCEACHGGAGEALCVGCHRVGAGAGNPHLPGTEPRGELLRQPCVACHTGGRRR